MMKKDNLERFIHDKRDAFDDKPAPKMTWGKIQKELNKDNKVPRRVSLWKFTRVAAAAVFLIGLGVVIGRQSFPSSEIASVEQNFPEFQEARTYYEVEVNERLAKLANYTYDASLDDDMSELDDFMKELRTELEEAPKGTEEKIINAMIQNYQDKLDILERVLESAENKNQLNENSTKDDTNI